MKIEELRTGVKARFVRIGDRVEVGSGFVTHNELIKWLKASPAEIATWILLHNEAVDFPEKYKINGLHKPTDLDMGWVERVDNGQYKFYGRSDGFEWPPDELLPEIRNVTIARYCI